MKIIHQVLAILLFLSSHAYGQSKETFSYPFGFQGMERDDDVTGKGNFYNTTFRQYDARLGRWWSMDPFIGDTLANVYGGFKGNPIIIVDPSGGVIYYANSDGTYVRTDEEATLSDGSHGIRMLNERGGIQYELRFHDQEGDVNRMNEFLEGVVRNEAIPGHDDVPIVHVISQSQARQILTDALSDRGDYELGLYYAYRESGGPRSEGSRLDFIRVLLGQDYAYPDGGPFYIFENARTGRVFNFKDAGNFMWGASSRALMGERDALVGAHVNNAIGHFGNVGNPSILDDPADQQAIILGRAYMMTLFPNLPWSIQCVFSRCHD